MSRLNISGRSHRGFTLVELLIVVVILGVLAAIVVPQFNGASAEAKEAALAQDVSAMRQAISLYRVQHNEDYPGPTAQDLADQLTMSTDADGDTAGSKYGPYFRAPWPTNNINGMTSILVVATMPENPTGATGWVYATNDGQLRANATGTGPSGKAYWDL